METRFNVIKESKFETLTDAEMNSIKGGFCISCKKRDRTIELGLGSSSNKPKDLIASTPIQKDTIEAMDDANN